jgi:hypothetical protein
LASTRPGRITTTMLTASSDSILSATTALKPSFTASFGYRLERTPERDKHANGVAERTVGITAVKTNIAMLNPFPSVSAKYWDLAMTYACDTHSFNSNSRINDSPYHYITGRHIDVTQLHPFFARFVAIRTLQALILEPCILTHGSRLICSGLYNSCYDVASYIAQVSCFSDNLNKYASIELKFLKFDYFKFFAYRLGHWP